jgi:hypothetical protein
MKGQGIGLPGGVGMNRGIVFGASALATTAVSTGVLWKSHNGDLPDKDKIVENVGGVVIAMAGTAVAGIGLAKRQPMTHAVGMGVAIGGLFGWSFANIGFNLLRETSGGNPHEELRRS